MKKLFTLLAAAMLMTTSAGAAVKAPANAGKMQLRPGAQTEFIQKAQRANLEAQTSELTGRDSKRVQRKSFVQGSTAYDLMIQDLDMRMCDVLFGISQAGDTVFYDFDDMPYYLVRADITMSNVESNEMTGAFMFFLGWPAYMLFDPAEPENRRMVSLDDMLNGSKKNLITQFYQIEDGTYVFYTDEQGYILGFPIVSNIFGATQMYGGYSDWVIATESNGQRQTIVDFQSMTQTENGDNFVFDTETNFRIYLDRDNSSDAGVAASNTSIAYNGDFQQRGFLQEKFVLDLPEVHIFNAGVQDPARMSLADDVFDFDWEPKKLYLFLAVGPNLTVGIREPEYTGETDAFNRDRIDPMPKNGGTANQEDVTYTKAYFWTPTDYDIEKEYASFTPYALDEYKYSILYRDDILYVVPEDYKITNGGVYNDLTGVQYAWSEEYGMKNARAGWLWYWDPSMGGQIAIHHEEGIMLSAFDTYLNVYYYTYKGKVIYHYDPEDMFKTREFDSVGTGVEAIASENGEFHVSAANGVLNVVAPENAEVAVYAVNGACVAKAVGNAQFNLEKGVYVVKAGNKAQKVIL